MIKEGRSRSLEKVRRNGIRCSLEKVMLDVLRDGKQVTTFNQGCEGDGDRPTHRCTANWCSGLVPQSWS